MGAGPLRLIGDPALADELGADGWELATETIDAPDPGDPELVRIAEGDRRLARRVRSAVSKAEFPLVLAGNCNSCLGTVAGLGPAAGRLGVVWFDAHAELLRSTIPGFAPVAERDVVLIGVRDLEPHQRAPLAASALRVLPGSSFAPEDLTGALDELRQRVSRVYLHIDLDALDTSEGRANRFAAEGGLSLRQLDSAIGLVFERFDVAAAAITAYDPSLDEDGRMARAGLRVLTTIARRALLDPVPK